MSDQIEYWTVFDTETTDLVGTDLLPLSKQPHIIEFSAVRISLDQDGAGDEEDVITFLCKPGGPFSDETTKITGITWEMVEGQPPFGHFLDVTSNIFQHSQARAGHNIVFDEKMLDNEFRRLKTTGTWKLHKQKRICTCEQTEHFCGKRASLGDLHEKLFGEKFEGAHRSLVDVRATVRCIRELRRLRQL